MSKRNKNRNRHQFQSSKQEGGQSSEGVVTSKPVTLDEHLDDLALQSIKVPSTDLADTTIAKASDVISSVVTPEGDTAVAEVSKVETGATSNRTVLAFGVGLAIGAIITFIFL